MNTAATGGERVAELRKARGITQTALARRAGISVSLLSKIEIGDRALTPGVAPAIARALRVPLAALYGDVEVTADQSAKLESLRTAVRRYDIPDQAPVPDPALLRGEVDQAIAMRAQADLAGLLRTLPGLLTRATTYAHTTLSPQGWALLSEVYSVVYYLACYYRWMDLVELAPIRQAWAADQRSQPLLSAIASDYRAASFFMWDPEGGLSVVDRAITTAQTALSGAQKAFATGRLYMTGMLLAGRLGERTEAQRHMDAARTAAQEFPREIRLHGQLFGPALTTVNALFTQADLGQSREVIRFADQLTGKDTGLSPSAIVYAHISTARAHLDLGNRDGAQASLVRAFTVAPQAAKSRPESLEVLRVLISLHRRSNPQLVKLATLAGLAA
jgi:transcriptional regulator with XRE-family HTH domain